MQQRQFRGPSSSLLLTVFGFLALYEGSRWLLHGVYQFVITDWSTALPFDAGVDLAAAKLFWQGISPYSPEGLMAVGVPAFGHPPTTPFWFLPLAQFDLPTMAHILGLLNFGLLAALIAVTVFTLRLPLPYITTLAIFGFIQDSSTTLAHNQIVQLSVAIAFGTVLAWKWLREGHDLSGGAVLGLVCTLKPFPCVILLLLLLLRRFRAVAAAALAFLSVAGLMTWRFGLEAWPLFLDQQKPIAAYWMGDVRNASLQGVLRRLLRERCGILVVEEGLVRLITVCGCLALLAMCTWAAMRALRRQEGTAWFDLSYALFCTLSAFLNPWVWQHYIFILILPALVAGRTLADRFMCSWRGWVAGEVPPLRQLRDTVLTGLGFLPLAAIPRWTEFTLSVNVQAMRNYCRYSGPPEVEAWLLHRAQYLEATSWLPWALIILVLTILLLLPRPQDAAPARIAPGAAGQV